MLTLWTLPKLESCGPRVPSDACTESSRLLVVTSGKPRSSKILFMIPAPDSKLILEVIPLMDLHLLFGVVSHLFKTLMEMWPKAMECPNALQIEIQPFHGGPIAGNDWHKHLKSIELLQRLDESDYAFQVFGPHSESLAMCSPPVLASVWLMIMRRELLSFTSPNSPYKASPSL